MLYSNYMSIKNTKNQDICCFHQLDWPKFSDKHDTHQVWANLAWKNRQFNLVPGEGEGQYKLVQTFRTATDCMYQQSLLPQCQIFWFVFIYLFILATPHAICGILVPRPGIEFSTSAVELRSPTHQGSSFFFFWLIILRKYSWITQRFLYKKEGRWLKPEPGLGQAGAARQVLHLPCVWPPS